jgi:hypothetical protein
MRHQWKCEMKVDFNKVFKYFFRPQFTFERCGGFSRDTRSRPGISFLIDRESCRTRPY